LQSKLINPCNEEFLERTILAYFQSGGDKPEADRSGDSDAAKELWDRYAGKLIEQARKRLGE